MGVGVGGSGGSYGTGTLQDFNSVGVLNKFLLSI
jgi:hypothetical protein